MNGITTTEFKLLCPDYKDIEGNELWNAMEDYMLIYQKYKHRYTDSRILANVYPSLAIEHYQVKEPYNLPGLTVYAYTVRSYVRIYSEEQMVWFITGYYREYRQYKYDDLSLINYIDRCHNDIYTMINLYIFNDMQYAITDEYIDKFDIYQGSEKQRLIGLKPII